MPVLAYARVSTEGQTLAAQQEALRAAGADKVYAEKISGAKSDRPALQRLLKQLGEGDTLLVTRLDRLARSTRDLLNILDQVSSAGATFKSLADAWADTTTPHGRLIITVLAGLAAYERELIRARTGEGRKRARERGQHLGRPFKLTLHQRREATQRYANGETLVDIGRSFNVAHTTVARAIELGASRQ
jgi:DNA invertase Pin-like site-specific DNA recombinase